MGKGSSGTNTTTSTNSPPPEVLAQYQNVVNQANQASTTPYTTGGFNAGNLVAGFNPTQESAFNTINNSQGIQTPYLNQAQSYLNNSQTPIWSGVQQYSPQTMAQYANPYLNQAVGATQANIEEGNAEQQQGVVGNAITSGAWGGDRSAIAQSELARQQALAENQTISGMENAGFNQQQQEFNAQQQAQIGANEANAWLGTQGTALEQGLGTTAQATALTGANAQAGAGAQQQQLSQSQLNIPYEQFLAQQAYPFQNLSWLSSLSTGLGSNMGGTSTTSSPAPNSSFGLFGLKRGGGIQPPHYDNGGMIPDVSVGYIPGAQPLTHGSGLPAPPKVESPPSSGLSGALSSATSLKNLFSGGGGKGGSAGASSGFTSDSNFSPSDINSLNFDFANAADSTASDFGAPAAASSPGWLADAGTYLSSWFNRGGEIPHRAAGGNMGMIPDIMQNGFDWSTIGHDVLQAIPQAIMMMNKGGFVPKHYDDGGGIGGFTPAVTGSNPFIQNRYAQYQSLPVEKLRELSARMGGSPQGEIVQQALRQKMAMSGGEQPAMARGGFTPKRFDTGGAEDSPPFTDDTTPAMTPDNAAKMSDLYGVPPVDTAAAKPAGFSAPSAAPSATSGIPDRDAFMKDYTSRVASAEPYNKPDPWLALAAGVAGALSGNSPQAIHNIGTGITAGLGEYGEQKKEAAAESEKRGTLQEQGESLYNNMVQHKEELARQNEQMLETGRHNKAEEANQSASLANTAQNQLWERQKPIPDGFGGFIIPNPKDPAHPTPINLGGSGGDASTASVANIYNPPKDADGKALHGDEFLKTIPPMVASQAKMYAEGNSPPPTGFASKPQLLAANNAATVYDPSYVGTRFSTIQDFTKSSTPAAATARSQNAIAEHLPVLKDAISALDNGDERPLNVIANTIAKQNGEAAPTNTEMAMTIVSDEAAKAIIGSKATQGDRQEFSKNLTTAAGRKQLQGQLDTAGRLIAGQMHAGEQAYNTGTGLDANVTPPETYSKLNYRDKFMSDSPNARKLFETYYPTPVPPVDKRVAGKTYWVPGGKQMVWQKDGWYPAKGAQ